MDKMHAKMQQMLWALGSRVVMGFFPATLSMVSMLSSMPCWWHSLPKHHHLNSYQLKGTIAIDDSSCVGFKSCYFSSGNLAFKSNSCQGDKACSNIEDYARISNFSCVEDYACSKFYSGNLTVAEMSCNGTSAVSSCMVFCVLIYIFCHNH